MSCLDMSMVATLLLAFSVAVAFLDSFMRAVI